PGLGEGASPSSAEAWRQASPPPPLAVKPNPRSAAHHLPLPVGTCTSFLLAGTRAPRLLAGRHHGRILGGGAGEGAARPATAPAGRGAGERGTAAASAPTRRATASNESS